ncbi:cyclin-L2-like [Artemia franciscana]|uniref:Cyclin-L1 n=1 Tax=Artemia franciscana TaxID=6661 RepID=A0AA88HJU6_ARTSF|nr:hypothetical protein QYM36_012012 [Artemia franciscana]
MAAELSRLISHNLPGITPLKNGLKQNSMRKDYGKVIISLENCLLPSERLDSTPSSKDGLDHEIEMDLRIYGCDLIQTAGILLRLPQVAMATGQVLFQRFYYSKSFVRHPMEVTAMGCVCLASKIEEAPRRIRDVISVFHHIKQIRAGKDISPVILDQNYINLKNQVIKAERRVLKELGFCVHVKHPHKIIITYLQQLGILGSKESRGRDRELLQLAWNYMNDSLRTDVFLRYSPETIACAVIYLAARDVKQPLPKNPSWYLIYDCNESDLKDICLRILKLYKRHKIDPDRLERVVTNLQKAYAEAKQRSRGMLAANSKQGTSIKMNGEGSGESYSPILKREKREDVYKRRRSRSLDRRRRSFSRDESESPRRGHKKRRSRSSSEPRLSSDKELSRRHGDRRHKEKKRGKENEKSYSRSLSPSEKKSHKHRSRRGSSRRSRKERRHRDERKR